jgi:hypothetical protein
LTAPFLFTHLSKAENKIFWLYWLSTINLETYLFLDSYINTLTTPHWATYSSLSTVKRLLRQDLSRRRRLIFSVFISSVYQGQEGLIVTILFLAGA